MGSKSLKSEIIKLRKKIFKNLRNKAFSFEDENQELTDYLENQIKLSKRKFSKASFDDLAQQVLKSKLIFVGDFHTFDQNIRNVLRIVKHIIEEKSECILCLEMIDASSQKYIDAYLEKYITELEFLDCINYNHSWRFPWSHYKLIFDLAKEYNIRIIGINTRGTLKERDLYAANTLVKIHKDHPDAKLLVFYGELHIARNKIPQEVEERCPSLKSLIIHQNLDEVYWKILKDDIEQAVVSYNQREYCIISAPPWIKYESMIYWYENLSDDPEFDIHEYIIEKGTKIFIDESKELFFNICLDLKEYLKLKLAEETLEDYNLYDHTNLEYIEEKIKDQYKPSVENFYQQLIYQNKSFRFPDKSTYYCSSYSMNRLAYLAGIHILHSYLVKKNIFAVDILSSKSLNKKFVLFTFEALYAYLFSKIINPHRKCDMYKDLVFSLKRQDKTKNMQAINLAIKVLNSEDLKGLLKGSKIFDLYEASLYVGHILGEYLYDDLQTMSDMSLESKDFNTQVTERYFYQLKNKILGKRDFKNDFKRFF